MSNSTIVIMLALALTASSLWTTAYLTMAVGYTELAVFGGVYAASIVLGLLVVGRLRRE